MIKKIFILYFAFNLVSCNFAKERFGDYYFNKAKKISEKEEVSESDIDRFYDYMMKSLDYKKDLKDSLPIVDEVTQASLKAGYIKAYENQLKFFKKYVEKNPKAWDVYLSIINIFSLKGDLYNLNNLKDDFEKRTISDKNFKLLSFIVETNLLYWSEVYGHISLNNTYDEMIDYLTKYCVYFKNINEVRSLNDQLFFKDSDSGLYYYFSTTLSDFLNKEKIVKRNCDIYSRLLSDSNFSKIARYTIDGNRHFVKKEYANAIIYYKAALSLNNEFYDAKKNLIESEFQNKLSLSLMKRDKTDVENLVYDRILDIDDMIRNADEEIAKLPFYYNDKFISQLYSLKAAMTMVLIDEKTDLSKRGRLESSVKKSIENALKYDPQNRMAKEISVRLEQK